MVSGTFSLLYFISDYQKQEADTRDLEVIGFRYRLSDEICPLTSFRHILVQCIAFRFFSFSSDRSRKEPY